MQYRTMADFEFWHMEPLFDCYREIKQMENQELNLEPKTPQDFLNNAIYVKANHLALQYEVEEITEDEIEAATEEIRCGYDVETGLDASEIVRNWVTYFIVTHVAKLIQGRWVGWLYCNTTDEYQDSANSYDWLGNAHFLDVEERIQTVQIFSRQPSVEQASSTTE